VIGDVGAGAAEGVGAGAADGDDEGAVGASGAGVEAAGVGAATFGAGADSAGAAELVVGAGSTGAAGVAAGAGALGAAGSTGVGAGAAGGAGALGVSAAAGVGAAGGVTADTACVTGAVAGATFVTVSVAAGTTCDSVSVTGVCGAGSDSWAIAGEAATRARMRAKAKAILRGIGAISDARTAPADPCFLVNYPSGERPLRFPSHELHLQVCEFRTLDANFSLKHEIALMSQFAGFLHASCGGNSDLRAQMGPEAGRFRTRGRRKQVARPGQITALRSGRLPARGRRDAGQIRAAIPAG